METSNIFEVGKFYRICSKPSYCGNGQKFPHLVVHKTKRKIVFEHLFRKHDESVGKAVVSFRLDVDTDGSESASSYEAWSMIPTMHPDMPCEKPKIWDDIPSDYSRPKVRVVQRDDRFVVQKRKGNPALYKGGSR